MTKLRALAVFWGVAIIVGAAWLQGFRPRGRALARFLGAETTHVSAHVVLYGALTAILWFASSGRRAIVIAVVATVALLQEAAQSVFFGRAPGRGEAFDLGVDALTMIAVLLLCGRFAPLIGSRT